MPKEPTPGEDAANKLLKEWRRVHSEILPDVLANEAKEAFIENFDGQGFFGKQWKKPTGRGNSDIRRRPNLPTLEQDGEIRGNIEVIRATKNDIQVGVRGIIYADLHNKGGRVPVTPRSRRFFWAKSMSSTTEKGRAFWRNMALNRSGFINMPKRKFIGHHETLNKRLVNNIIKEIERMKI